MSIVLQCASWFKHTPRHHQSDTCERWILERVFGTLSLLSLAGAATSTKVLSRLSWQNPSFVATKVCLSEQNFCHDKIVCHNKTFVGTNRCLSWQAYFCHDRRHVLSWQTCVCCDKSFIAIKKNSANKHKLFCDKTYATGIILSQQKVCFVTTKLLSWQKLYLWQLPPVIHFKSADITETVKGICIVYINSRRVVFDSSIDRNESNHSPKTLTASRAWMPWLHSPRSHWGWFSLQREVQQCKH